MERAVIPLYALRSRRKGYEVSVMKELMTMLGMAAGPVRPPLAPVLPEDRPQLKSILESLKPWL
jgi:5-dehydro-4-deoxyglucarate dehydratase